MSTRKYIHWRPELEKNEKGEMWANVHLLVGYNHRTITDFQSMAEELRRTFPEAQDNQIECGHVRKSSSVEGFSLIAWNTFLPEGEYLGWHQNKTGCPEYFW